MSFLFFTGAEEVEPQACTSTWGGGGGEYMYVAGG